VRIAEDPFRVEAHLVARWPVQWRIGEHMVEIDEGEAVARESPCPWPGSPRR
jgi:hypothetical protein